MSCPTAITVLEQRMNADLTQTQAVTQSNSSFQGVAVAIAIGNGSEAVASQEAEQCNKNLQIINADATNSAANLCGGCADKSKAPEINRNQDRSESQENDYIQIGSVAISIDGGRACAEQTLSQLNSNVQSALLLAKNINPCEEGRKPNEEIKPNRIEHKTNDAKTHKTKAAAYPGRNEKARVVIDLGSYHLEFIIMQNGDVYLNKKKIKSGIKC
ncbi:MAG: hypothetical protein ACOYIF_05020 [Acetivibrionales bacterium]|jgi:hypothetical protein